MESSRHPSTAAQRLLADQMLARLARWLRMLGYDCALVEPGGPTGEDLVTFARREGRILLTCARALAEAHPDTVVLIRHDPIPDQIGRVTDRWPLPFAHTVFSRCSVCNVPIESVSFDEVSDRLPPRVREHHPPLTRCPACGRVYWAGTHVDAMRRAFDHTLHLPDFGDPNR